MNRAMAIALALLAPALVGGKKHVSWLDWANADPKTASLSNPYNGNAEAIQAGEKLYQRYCSACHGQEARGLGRNPSLVSPTIKNTRPAAIEWLLRNGSLRRGMPSWSHLPPEQRWQLVSWMKSLN